MKLLVSALALMLVGCGGGGSSPSPVAVASAPASSPSAATHEATPTPSAPSGVSTPAPTEPPAQRAELTIESGFTYVPGDTNYIQYGVVVKNPNAKVWVAESVGVSITLYDSSGSVLKAEDETLRNVLPGSSSAVGGVIFDAKGVKKMEVDLDPEWVESHDLLGSWSVSRIKTTHGEYETRTTGVVKCTFVEDPEYAEVVAIYRNSGGHIIAGESDILDKVRCEKGTAFEITTLARLKNVARTQVYPGF